MTNHYARGSDFERRIATLLTADGYLVYRSAGSHGYADLVALKPGETILVQCKIGGAGAVSPADWNGLYGEAERVRAVAVVAYRPSPRTVAYLRVTGPKTGVKGKRPPAVPWLPDELAGASAEPAPDTARYAELLHEAAHGGGSCMCDEQPLVRKQFDRSAEVLLDALAGDGLLARPTPPAADPFGDDRSLPVATVTLSGVA